MREGSDLTGARVGLNLLYLIPGVVGGTETYAVSLIAAMSRIAPELELVVFVSREAASIPLPSTRNVRRVVCPVAAVSRGFRYFWEQCRLPSAIASERVDVLHSLGYTGPLRPGVPHLVTIHDVNFRALRASMPLVRRSVLGAIVPRVARRASRVLTLSEFSRGELHRHLGVPPDRIVVTGAAPRALRRPSGDARDAVRRRGITTPYVAAMSSQSPHKNLPRLVGAFARVAASVPHDLLIIGHLPPASEISRTAEQAGVGDRVHTTGYVSEDELAALLSGADLFVLPSLYEGFGLPLLEAQALGTPVACSSAASLPEVADGSAQLFDPTAVDSIADAMRIALGDAALRRRLAKLGTRNAARHSWDLVAARTLDQYADVLRPAVRRADLSPLR